METTAIPSNSPGVRSTFLTVICVLSFISGGYGIIGAVYGYAVADQTAASTSEAMWRVF